ncbi:MAG: STAS domain-containing protein [Planctomycetota bacterium]
MSESDSPQTLSRAQRPDGRTELRLHGRLDTSSVLRIEADFDAALADGGDAVVDLTEVELLSSHGIRLLLRAAKNHDRRGLRLVLVAPPVLVDTALKPSYLDRIIDVVPDANEAHARLDNGDV